MSGTGGSGLSGGAVRPEPPAGNQTFSGRTIGASWGIFQSDGRIKKHFADLVTWQPPPSRLVREIFVGPRLSAFYNMGVDSSGHKREWVAVRDGELKMLYPANQQWGTVFITVGKPADHGRSWKDFSEFKFLTLELRGEDGGEPVEISIKDRSAPNDGERRVSVKLGTRYQSYSFPLADFASPRFRVPRDLDEIYVVAQFVFTRENARTVYARNIRYTRNVKE
jgi:hypothetical protein